MEDARGLPVPGAGALVFFWGDAVLLYKHVCVYVLTTLVGVARQNLKLTFPSCVQMKCTTCSFDDKRMKIKIKIARATEVLFSPQAYANDTSASTQL